MTIVTRPWGNSRRKLHGGLALRRVLDSVTLRREAVRALSEQELRGELARRERLARARGWLRVLARVVDAAVYAAAHAIREVP